jgi:type I restriction enzyme S subunit
VSNGRYKPYPRYSASGEDWIGDIPTGWKVLRGKFLFREVSERSECGEETLLSVSEYYGVKPRGEVIEEGEFLSRAESLEGYKKCQVDDLVMNIMLAWKRGLGVSKFDGIVSPAYSVFRFFESIDPNYMHHLLRTDLYTGHFKTRSTGVIDSRLRLYPESFFDTAIVVPPRSEQTQIAKFLDHETAKTDRLIEKQEALIRLLKEKRQAVISHAVTKGLNPHAPLKDSGIEWLGQVPAHWVAISVKYVASRIGTGGTPKKENSFTDLADVPWFTPGDFSDQGELSSASKHVTQKACLGGDAKTYPAGSVVVIGIGATLGKVGYSEREFSCNQQINIITPNIKTTATYLMHALSVQTEQMRQLSNASTIGIMNQEKTGLVKIAVPPPEEQDHIVEYIDQKSRQFAGLLDRASEQITSPPP